MLRVRKYGLALIASFAVSSCGISTDTTAAEAQVAEFHKLLDAAEFAEIYQQASPELKKRTTQEKFAALLDAVHRKLGPTKSSVRQTWGVNATISGTYTTLNYKTSYAEGDAAENFVYRSQDNAVALVGYHINSDALILK